MSGGEPDPTAIWAEARRWFAKSIEDRRMAQLALAAQPALVEPAAYHCQQAAEKLLKCLLIASSVSVPRTHDLEHLGSLLAPLYPSLTKDLDKLSVFTPWAVVTRYPAVDSNFGLTADDVRKAVEDLTAFEQKVPALASGPLPFRNA